MFDHSDRVLSRNAPDQKSQIEIKLTEVYHDPRCRSLLIDLRISPEMYSCCSGPIGDLKVGLITLSMLNDFVYTQIHARPILHVYPESV